MIRRRFPALILTSTLLAPGLVHAQDDDWSITRGPHHGGSHPSHPSHPGHAPRPQPHRPTPTPVVVQGSASPAPVGTDPNRARRDRMISALTQSVLHNARDDAAPLTVLLRMVRERDGGIDALVNDFEARARAATADPAPHLALGHLYREAGRYDDAAREYTAAEHIAPTHPAAARALGALFQRMDRRADARTAYERALEHTTERLAQTDTLRQLMDLSLEAHDVAGARTYHRRLVALDRTSSTLRRELADALLSRRLFADAVTEYQSLAHAMAGDNRVLPPVLRDLGRAYMGNQQLDEALATFRRALAVAGSDAGIRRELYDAMTEVYAARNQLPQWIAELERSAGLDAYERAVLVGRLQDQSGNTTGAIAAYRRAVAARPSDIDAHVRIAQLFHQQGMRAEEIAEYRRLVVLAPREPRFVIELADLLVSQGAQEEAFRMLAQASARAGSDSNVHERLSEVYARHGRQQEALHEIELVARFDPTSPAGLVALGRQYMELGQRDRALATWHRILEVSHDRARGAVALAEVYADNAMLAEAIEMYREAVRLRPNELDYHRGLATVLERARQMDNAIAEWRHVIELAQADRDVRRHARESIVRLWGLEGRLNDQITSLQRGFDATPPDLEAGRDLAEALVRARRGEDAERVLRRLTELDPSDVTSLVALERVLSTRGDLAGAITVLRRLTEADPRRARDWFQRMAQHAMALHHDEEAIEYATRAVQLNDQDATAHLRLSELYRARNDMPHAIASLRRAIELNDRLFATYFELADLYLGYENEPAEAIALYRRVIALAPDDDYVLRAGRQAIQLAPVTGLGDDVERDLVAASAAAPTRAVFRRLLVAYYDATARPLIDRVQQASANDAVQARQQLSRMGVRAIAPLLDALADNDPGQQRIALDILGYLGNPNATSALVALAENPATDGDIRRRALIAAGTLGDARALPRFVALADHDTTLAALATWSIGHVHTPGATAVLVRLVLRPASEGQTVRTMAALALAGTRDASARAALRAALTSGTSEDPIVRAAAAFALGGAVDRRALPALLQSLETGPDVLRSAAASALGASSFADTAAPALARALFTPRTPEAGGERETVRRAAARALARLAGGAAPDGRAFDDPLLAQSATSILRAWIDPPGMPIEGAAAVVRFRVALADAANAGLRGLAENVGATLAAFGEPGALLPLASAASLSATPGGHAALERLLGDLVPALVPHVTHPDPAVRRAVVRVLAPLESPDVTAALARATTDRDEPVAMLAIHALALHGTDHPAFEALAARLAQEVPWAMRAAAAESLAGSHDPAAVPLLITALREDPYEYVRVAAARSLGASRSHPDARAALEETVSAAETPASVRSAAREALGGP